MSELRTLWSATEGAKAVGVPRITFVGWLDRGLIPTAGSYKAAAEMRAERHVDRAGLLRAAVLAVLSEKLAPAVVHEVARALPPELLETMERVDLEDDPAPDPLLLIEVNEVEVRVPGILRSLLARLQAERLTV